MDNQELKLTVEKKFAQAQAYQAKGAVSQALTAFSETAKQAALADWPEKEIEAYYSAGLLFQDQGARTTNFKRMEQAVAAFEQGLAVAVRINDQISAGTLQLALGFIHAHLEHSTEAIEYLKAAAVATLDTVEFEAAFSALTTLGVLLSNSDRAVEAIPYYLRVLKLAEAQPDEPVAVADTLANLAIALEKAGYLVEAFDAMERYYQILKEAGDTKTKDVAKMVSRLRDRVKKELDKR